MNDRSCDKEMQEYLKVKKTVDQYYQLKLLLETVRKPDVQSVISNAPKPLVQPKTKTKRRQRW